MMFFLTTDLTISDVTNLCLDMQRNAVTCYAALSSCPGLTPVMPCGAMFMMVKIDIDHFPEFASDVNFTEKMVTEQSVFCLPGTV